MGAVEAVLFAEEGAKVVIGDVLEDEGKTVADSIPDGNAAFIRLDVTSEDDWQAAVALAVQRYGKLDVLVNNAGVGATSMIEETTVAEWDRVMDINAKGVFLGTKYAIPEMRRAGRRFHNQHLFAVGAWWAWTSAARSTRPPRARCGCSPSPPPSSMPPRASGPTRFTPDPIVTPMTDVRRADPAISELMVSRIPLGRYGESIEVAYGVLYLASDESSFVTGSELVIDGGWVAQ